MPSTSVLTLEFELQLDEWKASYPLRQRTHPSSPRFLRQLRYIGYGSVALGVLLLATQDDHGGWIAPIALMAVGLFIPIRLTLAAFSDLSSQWRAAEHLLQPTRWEFSDHEIRVTSQLYTVTYRWEVFKSWTEGPTMFLIHQTQHAYEIMPKRAFASKDAVARFREILSEKIQKPLKAFPVTSSAAPP
jgi:hypothetical protein